MKFTSEEAKTAAIRLACDAWGKSLGETKFHELMIQELQRGYIEETPEQRLGKVAKEQASPAAAAAAAPAPAPVAPATETPEQTEEKQKRHRRTKAEMEAARAAEAAAAPAAPVLPVPTASEVVANAAPAAPSAVITQKNVQELMGALLIRMGNTPEARTAIVKILKDATGKSKTVEITSAEDLTKARNVFAQELKRLDDAETAKKAAEDDL